MLTTKYFICLLFVSVSTLVSQTLTDSSAKNFIYHLLTSSSEIRHQIEPADLRDAERLCIQYQNVSQKFFIGNDFPDSLKALLLSNHTQYSFSIQQLNTLQSVLTVSVPEFAFQQKFYFSGERCISPVTFYTAHWHKAESKYLIYRISDSSLFNSYSMKKLDEFVDRIMKVLNFSAQEKKWIAKEKIFYIRCKNENEIEQITGFKSLGMALLSYDAVVTQFNCHYHEIAHILINYKLKNLPLYTHPFFQEGFAVAVGGRGGKEAQVISDLGYFIASSEFETYTSLLNRRDFYGIDASISYALSGLYNQFLLRNLGAKKYISMYREFSHSNPDSIGGITEKMLPLPEQWRQFLKSYQTNKPIKFTDKQIKGKTIWSKKGESVSEVEEYYIFMLKDTMTILSENSIPKYTISVTQEEIRIINLFTMNTIANFVLSFSFPPEQIPYDGRAFKFYVKKSIFDEPLSKEMSFATSH